MKEQNPIGIISNPPSWITCKRFFVGIGVLSVGKAAGAEVCAKGSEAKPPTTTANMRIAMVEETICLRLATFILSIPRKIECGVRLGLVS